MAELIPRRRDVRAPRVTKIECPVCGGRLRRHGSVGYGCGHCGSHFSASHAQQLQKHHLRTLIQRHFSQATPERTVPRENAISKTAEREPDAEFQEETQRVVVADEDGKIERAIIDAKASVRTTTQHLEDLLAAQGTAPTQEKENVVGENTPAPTIARKKEQKHAKPRLKAKKSTAKIIKRRTEKKTKKQSAKKAAHKTSISPSRKRSSAKKKKR